MPRALLLLLGVLACGGLYYWRVRGRKMRAGPAARRIVDLSSPVFRV